MLKRNTIVQNHVKFCGNGLCSETEGENVMKNTSKAYINKTVYLTHAILCIIIFVAYLAEFFKKDRSWQYTLMIAALTLVPITVEYLILKADAENEKLKHIISVTYGLLYLVAVFTTHSILPFTYVFPMFIMVALYSDVKLCIRIGVAATAINLADVVYIAVTQGFEKEEIPDVGIRVLVSVVTALYMTLATLVTKKVNEEKLRLVNEQKQRTDSLLENTLDVAGNMISGIRKANEKMELLGESMQQIHESMGEVSVGSTETADSVQEQLQQTESIQGHIKAVQSVADGMNENTRKAAGLVEAGAKGMDELSRQVEKSMHANDLMMQQMEELKEYTARMNTIIETITSIANSTGMLALNASIEAARAGEAGRGFAVVAEQISGLASQTKIATVNITEMIENINQELVDVASAVETVTESNRQNAESTRIVKEHFMGIASETENIGVRAAELTEVLEGLEKANNEIVDKIQTISAITEEVSAHASETFDSCEENANLVQTVSQIVQELDVSAKMLQESF